MSKERIAPGVFQYPHTPEGLQEAIADATIAANATNRNIYQYRYTETMYVLEDKDYYFAPLNNHKRQSMGYRGLTLVATVEPTKESE